MQKNKNTEIIIFCSSIFILISYIFKNKSIFNQSYEIYTIINIIFIINNRFKVSYVSHVILGLLLIPVMMLADYFKNDMLVFHLGSYTIINFVISVVLLAYETLRK